MNYQLERAETFRKLHRAGDPLVLFNAWDAGSARAVAQSGAHAIATSSWAVAASKGQDDGERLALSVVLDTVRDIVQAVDLPVSVDFESGYSESEEAVVANVTALIEAGAIGCNFEDGIPGVGSMRPTEAQAARLRAVRTAASGASVPMFINARTDLFLLAPAAQHAGLITEASARAKAYADAGADGFFVPGLIDAKLIASVVQASPLPVNVMVGEGSPGMESLVATGVARISYGPGPWLQAMAALREAAKNVDGR